MAQLGDRADGLQGLDCVMQEPQGSNPASLLTSFFFAHCEVGLANSSKPSWLTTWGCNVYHGTTPKPEICILPPSPRITMVGTMQQLHRQVRKTTACGSNDLMTGEMSRATCGITMCTSVRYNIICWGFKFTGYIESSMLTLVSDDWSRTIRIPRWSLGLGMLGSISGRRRAAHTDNTP